MPQKSNECALICGSINKKSLQIKDNLVLDKSIDILALAETWLRAKECSDFVIRDISPTRYAFVHIMPLGLVALAEALAYRKDLNIEQLETNVFKSFEFKELLLNFSASIIHIVFTCRQPISAKNGLTYALFFDDFSTLLEPLVSASGKLLLAGDLNFHVNNPSESNAYKFLDVLSCFNLNTLNVSIPIHKSI